MDDKKSSAVNNELL